jgi:hypothetical protein
LLHFLREYRTTLRHPINLGEVVEIAVEPDSPGYIAEAAGLFTGDPVGFPPVAALADFKSGRVNLDTILADLEGPSLPGHGGPLCHPAPTVQNGCGHWEVI